MVGKAKSQNTEKPLKKQSVIKKSYSTENPKTKPKKHSTNKSGSLPEIQGSRLHPKTSGNFVLLVLFFGFVFLAFWCFFKGLFFSFRCSATWFCNGLETLSCNNLFWHLLRARALASWKFPSSWCDGSVVIWKSESLSHV